MEKLYYTIGEVAEMLGENTSLVRFWTNSFPRVLNPKRNGKGNRLYTEQEIAILKEIHYLVKESGMTLDGAAKRLSQEKDQITRNVKILDSLKSMREQLVDIKKSM